jgi:hypothetical protein
MKSADPASPHLQTLVAALLYLMSRHARSGCPRLAACISEHLHRISLHPDAAPLVREVCAGLRGTWATEPTGHSQERRLH